MTTLASLSPAEVRALGGLVVSCAGANEAALGMRALSWYNSILRLGLRVPFVVVHDLGAAMLGAASSIRVPPDLPPNFAAPHATAQAALAVLGQYAQVLEEIAKTDIAAQISATRIEDSVLATLLTRALGPVVDRWRSSIAFEPVPINAERSRRPSSRSRRLWAAVDRRPSSDFLQHLLQAPAAPPARHRADRPRHRRAPRARGGRRLHARDRAGRPPRGVQLARGQRRGELLPRHPPERARDEARGRAAGVLRRRLLGRGARTARSTPSCSPRWPTTTTSSSSASSTASCSSTPTRPRTARPRGLPDPRRRQRLDARRAHGLRAGPRHRPRQAHDPAGLRGAVRFFDSRLYEPMRLRRGRSGLHGAGPLHVAGILAFKGERGRNYARVFSQLASELERCASARRSPCTSSPTPSATCPSTSCAACASSAEVCGVFMLPSRGALDLEYLPLLTLHEVVTDAALRDRSERATRALSIVEGASVDGAAATRSRPPPRGDDAERAMTMLTTTRSPKARQALRRARAPQAIGLLLLNAARADAPAGARLRRDAASSAGRRAAAGGELRAAASVWLYLRDARRMAALVPQEPRDLARARSSTGSTTPPRRSSTAWPAGRRLHAADPAVRATTSRAASARRRRCGRRWPPTRGCARTRTPPRS
jgi:hypothetical protein